MKIHIAHSPDSDDAFMFYPINCHKVDSRGYEFIDVLSDIETLNNNALEGKYEVSAISFHAYPYIADRYTIMPCGGSMGDNYGPMLVAKEMFELSELSNKKIGIPGKLTSAFLALRLFNQDFGYEVIKFDEIIPAVKQGKIDAGLIIHEGQLMYEEEGLYCLLDLGKWWYEKTNGLPLPLGCNVIKKDLAPGVIKDVTEILKESIEYSLLHREEAVNYSMKYARDMTKERTDKFIGMYVNNLSLDYGTRGNKAIEIFLQEAYSQNLIPTLPLLAFA